MCKREEHFVRAAPGIQAQLTTVSEPLTSSSLLVLFSPPYKVEVHCFKWSVDFLDLVQWYCVYWKLFLSITRLLANIISWILMWPLVLFSLSLKGVHVENQYLMKQPVPFFIIEIQCNSLENKNVGTGAWRNCYFSGIYMIDIDRLVNISVFNSMIKALLRRHVHVGFQSVLFCLNLGFVFNPN